MFKWVIGVIGGLGLYEIDGLEYMIEVDVEIFWGVFFDILIKGQIGDVLFVFLLWYGKGYWLILIIVFY